MTTRITCGAPPDDPVWKTLLPPEASVQDAIRSLDATALQIVLVADRNGRLIGTVTDGDIRRGLLRGLSIDARLEEIVYRDPLVVPPDMGSEMVLQLMLANKLRQLPVVDRDRRLIGLRLIDNLIVPQERRNTMVIMAGGRGERLRPYTENCPKPMLQVGGKPMLEHIIARAKAEGIHRFVLAVHYLGQMIEEHFGNGEKWQVRIEYLREEAPLGTAGAISLLAERPREPLIVTNGDVLTDVRYGDMLDFHVRHAAAATMAVRMYEWQHPFGVVQTKGVDIVGFDEKPIMRTHINAGIYVLEPTALEHLAAGENCDMPTLFQRLHERSLRTIVYPMHEPWLDVGRPADLHLANSDTANASGTAPR